MNPLRLRIPGQFLDAYLYSGHLFAIFEDLTIRYIGLPGLVQSISPTGSKLLEIAFCRNSWMNNAQAGAILSVSDTFRSFSRGWRQASRCDLVAKPTSEWKVLDTIPFGNIQDFKIYGLKVMVGSRHGVFECGLRLDEMRGSVERIGPLEKRFGGRVTALAAKGGQMIISAGEDGLFHGPIGFPNAKTVIFERPAKPISFRVGWRAYDLVNYVSQGSAEYLVNRTRAPERREYAFSEGDEPNEKLVIEELAAQTFSPTEWLSRANVDLEEVSFMFNSGKNSTCLLKSGELVSFPLRLRNDLPSSGRAHHFAPTSRLRGRDRKIFSMHAGGQWTAVEFFDHVDVFSDSKWSRLENGSSIAVRTFPASLRYKSLVLIVNDSGIVIHSLPPIANQPA